MKSQLLIISAALLTGCATPADMRKKQPDISLASKQSAKQVAICISSAWEGLTPLMSPSSLPINTQLRIDGYTVTGSVSNMLGVAWPAVLADIKESPTGSTTRYYKDGAGLGAYNRYDEPVKQCQ